MVGVFTPENKQMLQMKAWFNALLSSLKKLMENVNNLNLKVCCVCSHYIENSTEKLRKYSPLFKIIIWFSKEVAYITD